MLTLFFFHGSVPHPALHSFPTRRSSDLTYNGTVQLTGFVDTMDQKRKAEEIARNVSGVNAVQRSEEHTSELQSLTNLVCRLLLEKKKKKKKKTKTKKKHI